MASGGGTGRTLHPDNMAAGPASYGMTDTMGRMHSDAQFAGSSSVPAHVEMMGLIGMGNNPMVGASVAVAVAVEQAMKGILMCSEKELVSIDSYGNKHSSIVDMPNTNVLGGNMVKILSWYITSGASPTEC